MKPTIIIGENSPYTKEIQNILIELEKITVITVDPKLEVELRKIGENLYSFPWKKTSPLSIRNLFLEVDRELLGFEDAIIVFDLPNSRNNYDKITFNEIHFALEDYLKPYLSITKEFLNYYNSKKIPGKITFIFFYSEKIDNDPILSCIYNGIKSYVKGLLNFYYKHDEISMIVIENNEKISQNYIDFIKKVILRENVSNNYWYTFKQQKSFFKNLF